MKNRNDVVNCIQNFIVPDGFSLVSFDVKSLFTCIPQDLALESIRTAIDEDDTLMHRTNLDNESIMKLSELCVNANIFQYDNKLYKQITGMPMGSPVSVVVAELTLQNIEKKNILNYNTNDILLWKIYVDDCLAVVKTSQIDNLLGYINNNTQFTVEKEIYNILAFLDVNIYKQNDGSL